MDGMSDFDLVHLAVAVSGIGVVLLAGVVFGKTVRPNVKVSPPSSRLMSGPERVLSSFDRWTLLKSKDTSAVLSRKSFTTLDEELLWPRCNF